MKTKIVLSILFAPLLFVSSFALAADNIVNAPTPDNIQNTSAPYAEGKFVNPIKDATFESFVARMLKVAVEVLTPLVVLAFIWSGFLFVRAQGNPEEIARAKNAILWSVVGAFILMASWGFAEIIKTTISDITGIQQ